MNALRGRGPLRQRRVLWAEDAPDDQFLIRHAVGQMAQAPDIAFVEDGASLLQAVGQARPDLVVLDINMPVLNGIETLRRLRSRVDTRDLPAVLFSTARHERDLAASRELKALDFIQKPTHFDDFSAAVRRILAHVAAPRPPPALPAGEPRPALHEGAGWRPVSRPAFRE